MVGGGDHVGSYACTEAEGIREVSVHQTVSEFKFQSSHFPAGCPLGEVLNWSLRVLIHKMGAIIVATSQVCPEDSRD